VREKVERPTYVAVYIEVMYSPLDSYVVGFEFKKLKRIGKFYIWKTWNARKEVVFTRLVEKTEWSEDYAWTVYL
jgi:hypothetical protein